MMNFWIILVSTPLFLEASYGMEIPMCSESTQDKYPYPGDCTKYIQCNNGQTAVLNCGPESHFNSQTHQCDSSYVEQDCHRPAYSQETLQIFCKNIVNGAIPHPYDCSKFIECSPAISTIKNCSTGLVYNPTAKVCDWPTSVKGCHGNYGNGQEHRQDVTLVSFRSGENHQNQLGDEEFDYGAQGNSLDAVQRSANQQLNIEEGDDDEECEDDLEMNP